MSRKEYQLITGVIQASVDEVATNDGFRTLQQVAEDLAQTFQLANRRFDRARFLTACGFEA